MIDRLLQQRAGWRADSQDEPASAEVTWVAPEFAAAALGGRVLHFDPGAADGGDGSEAAPFNAFGTFLVEAGDTLLLRGGTVVGGFAITTVGSAAQPVVVGSYGVGRAMVEGSVAITGAAFVTLENLDIAGGLGFGVLLSGGTVNCTVRNCDIGYGLGGVLVQGDGAVSNRIIGNEIHDNDYVGVWLDDAIAVLGQEIEVSGNTIFRNGQQGILLHGSRVVVDGNTVVNNGLSRLPGISAIHAYADSAADPAGKDNTISNNVVAYQRDGSSIDGNGITLDHWSGNTVVSGNHIFGNDGCGIDILSSFGNTITGNVVHDNMVDSGGTHVVSHAEIFVGEAGIAPGLTTGNTISGNTLFASSGFGAAIQVAAQVTGEVSNVIAGNTLGRLGDGKLWIWGAESGGVLADWNALPHGGVDEAPAGAAPVAVSFDPALLAAGFTLYSALLTAPVPGGLSMLVAHGSVKDVTGGVLGSWIAGDGRANILQGTGGTNLISAGPGDAVLLGGPGADSLFGGAGVTLLIAGDGGALLVGGSGDSRIFGGAGVDALFAGNGTGAKLLDGGGGGDVMIGGGGVDRFVLGNGVDVVLEFTQGQDLLDVSRLGVAGIGELVLAGDAAGGVIIDGAGDVRAIIAGFDVTGLVAADFVFSAPVAGATVSVVGGSPAGGSGLVLAEGGTGATGFVFTVNRSGDLSRADSIAWRVAGGGVDAADFVGGVLPGGRVTFVAGEAARTVTVAVAGDGVAEGDEDFSVMLGAAYAGLAVGTGTALATILDDDTPPCFAPGTRIATPFGARAVETLRAGDAVLTAAGAAGVLCWVGGWDTRADDPAQRAVRVLAGAFGPGLPTRDLVLSPRHALWLEGVMVPAVALVDGVRVVREAVAPVRYHHIALARHAAIRAEDLPVESFCGAEGSRHRGAPEVAGALPRLEEGLALEALRRRLGLLGRPQAAGREGFLERVLPHRDGCVVEGWASDPGGPARLEIEVGGARIPVVANRWRIDLDRVGLPAAGFRSVIPHDPRARLRVVRAGDGAVLETR